MGGRTDDQAKAAPPLAQESQAPPPLAAPLPVPAANNEYISLHEELTAEMRRWTHWQVVVAAVVLIPASVLLWVPQLTEQCPAALQEMLQGLTATLVTAAAALQLAFAYAQLRASDADRITSRLHDQPPVYVSIETPKPPLLQALDVLTSLRSHMLTDGSPCTPRLIIQHVDPHGNPVELNARRAQLGTSRGLVREPLEYAKAKIRQAVKDPRALMWEDTMGLTLQRNSITSAGSHSSPSSHSSNHSSGLSSSFKRKSLEGNLSPRGPTPPLGVDSRHGSQDYAEESDLHGFITANYGSTLRYSEETALSKPSPVGGSPRTSLKAAGLAVAAANAFRPHDNPYAMISLEPAKKDEAKRLLQIATKFDAAAWHFDAFSLARCTNDHALLFAGHHFFDTAGLIDAFGLDRTTLLAFLRKVESGYRPNPYHSRDHACDVLQSTLWILNSKPSGDENSNGAQKTLVSLVEPLDVLALLVAAIGHDIDHTGQNNAFHVSTSTDLAILYNDRSVLENHHCAKVFAILQNPHCALLAPLTVKQRRELRDIVVSVVLGTDMSVHFKNVDRLSAAISAGNFDLTNRDDKTFVLEMVLHSADVANPCRPEPIYRMWTDKVMEEFYDQGDKEKDAGLPVSKFFDRDAPNLPRCQVGFINFVVQPLFTVMGDLLPLSELLSHLHANLRLMEQECADH